MLTTNPIYDYDESLKTVITAFTPRQRVFFMPMAWTRAENNQYQPKHLITAFSESMPLLILNGKFLKKVIKMINAISIFKFNQNQIRTQVINNEPWFCLADCCQALGIKQNRDTATRLSQAGVGKTDISHPTGKKQITIINEPNLYRLIFRSNKPQAQAFADWVYSEVLPQIRKTGAYGVPAETAPAPLDAKTLGGVVKRCAAAAVRDELETLPELVKAQVEQTVYEVLSKVFYPGITEHPSGMPFSNWAVAAVQAIGAMTSEYDNLKQKQQAVINLLQDKENKQ